MVVQAVSDTEPNIKLPWLTGEVRRFQSPHLVPSFYFVHVELLNARCPGATFEFVEETPQHIPNCILDKRDLVFPTFLLWIYTDSLASLGSDPEEQFVSAFCFAQKYELLEFQEFLSSEFEKWAPLYYGGRGENEEPHNPSMKSFTTACNVLNVGSAIRCFIIEQFVRSWLFRNSYSVGELKELGNEHPEVLRYLFSIAPAVSKASAAKSLAVFGQYLEGSSESKNGADVTQPIEAASEEPVPAPLSPESTEESVAGPSTRSKQRNKGKKEQKKGKSKEKNRATKKASPPTSSVTIPKMPSPESPPDIMEEQSAAVEDPVPEASYEVAAEDPATETGYDVPADVYEVSEAVAETEADDFGVTAEVYGDVSEAVPEPEAVESSDIYPEMPEAVAESEPGPPNDEYVSYGHGWVPLRAH